MRPVLTLLTVLVWGCAALAQGPGLAGLDEPMVPTPSQGSKEVAFRVTASHLVVAPGQQVILAADVQIEPGWVLYSPEPHPTEFYSPQAARIELEAGGWTVDRILWPLDSAHQSDLGDKKVLNYVYENRFVAFVLVRAPQGAAGPATLTVRLTGQICKDACLGVSQSQSVTVSAGPENIPNPAYKGEYAALLAQAMTVEQLAQRHATPSAPAKVQMTVWAGLGLALLAGMILNIMPCVLPVIPLKVLSLVHHAHESHRRFVTLGLTFVGGILLFFLGIVVVNIVLRLGLQRAFEWGTHFQRPELRIGMGLLMVAMAVNLFDVFTVMVPRKVAALGSEGEPKHGVYLQSLGMGVLTAVLSTPCSFAILTIAFAWAQVQPLWLGSVAIMLIGVGMSLPYVALTAFPQLVRKLPKPGRWMELFKEAMGFVLLIVAIWLIGTIGEDSYTAWVLAYGVVLALCLWMWGRWLLYSAPRWQKIVVRGLAVVLAVGAGVVMLRPPQPSVTQFADYEPCAMETALKQGRPVLVKFTASWCLTCKSVDLLVYEDAQVARELRRRNVLVLKGDVTTEDLPANRLLRETLKETGGIPISVLFVPGQDEPVRLSGVFDKSMLLAELDKIQPAKPAGP